MDKNLMHEYRVDGGGWVVSFIDQREFSAAHAQMPSSFDVIRLEWKLKNVGAEPIKIDDQDWLLQPGDYMYWDSKTMRHEMARMYGWHFDVEPEAPKPPEKSPADKALDEFIKRREARREGSGQEAERIDAAKAFRDSYPERKAAAEQSEALGNAMSKLTHWEQTVHERIMPYRVAM